MKHKIFFLTLIFTAQLFGNSPITKRKDVRLTNTTTATNKKNTSYTIFNDTDKDIQVAIGMKFSNGNNKTNKDIYNIIIPRDKHKEIFLGKNCFLNIQNSTNGFSTEEKNLQPNIYVSKNESTGLIQITYKQQ